MKQIMSFTETWQMFSDVWKLYKVFAVKRMSDADIEAFTKAAKEIYQKYRTPLAKDIVIAIISEIERSVRYFTEEEDVSRKE